MTENPLKVPQSPRTATSPRRGGEIVNVYVFQTLSLNGSAKSASLSGRFTLGKRFLVICWTGRAAESVWTRKITS